MRERSWILAFAGLNLVLGTGWYTTWLSNAQRRPMPVQAAAGLPHTVKTNVVVRHSNFIWTELESTNYFTYISNLRMVGCPESAIRSIVLGEINQIYIRRRNNELVFPEQEWWRSSVDLTVAREAVQKVRSLEAERQALLTKLLGLGWEASSAASLPPLQNAAMAGLLGFGWDVVNSVEPAATASAVSLTGAELGDLSEQRKEAVYQAVAGARQKLEGYRQGQKLGNQPVDLAEVVRLEQEERNQLARLLNPAQDEEFLLRYSQTAQQLREQMRSLNLGPDQFRALFQATDPIDLLPGYYYAGTDANLLKQQKELQAEHEAMVKEVLGEAVYATYKLNQDPLYLYSKTNAQQAGIAPESVLTLYQINRATQTELERIGNDTNLTEDEKIDALAAARVQQQQTVAQLLGPALFQRWLQSQAQLELLPGGQQAQSQLPPSPPGLPTQTIVTGSTPPP